MVVSHNKKIKVLHVIGSLGPGGAQEVLKDIVRYSDPKIEHHIFPLIRCQDDAFHYNTLKQDVVIQGMPFFMSTSENLLSTPRLSRIMKIREWSVTRFIEGLFVRKVWRWIVYKFVRKLVVLNGYNILHAHLLDPTVICARVKKKLIRQNVKTVVTFHANFFVHSKHEVTLFKKSFKHYDKVVYEIKFAEQDVISSDVERNKIQYIPFGVEEKYNPSEVEKIDTSGLRQEFNIPFTAKILLSISRLNCRERGIDALVKMMGYLLRERQDVFLLIVGTGVDEKCLKALAENLGTNKHIIFAGYRNDLLNLYALCDLYLSVSVGDEVGIAGMQAIACGKCCVAIDAFHLGESTNYKPFVSVTNEIEFCKKTIQLLDDVPYRETFTKQATKFLLKNYSSLKTARDYSKLYDNLVSQ
jgi:glycosyltransferase involved in cell wall biosynthesis